MSHEEDRKPRRSHPRRSASPESREYEHRGGGERSSGRRSPGYYRAPRDEYDRSDRGGRARDNGYARRDSENKERGYDEDRRAGRGDDGWSGKRRRNEGYDSKDREREREKDRQRYDVDVKGEDEKPLVEPEKPNFGTTGLLAKEANTVKGVELKYVEPPEARKPLDNWRLYVFKGKEQLDLVHIYKQSAYLIGRDQVVTDIPIAHPSCSKQHAAIQFRQISEKNEYGEVATSVKPFIIDLESTNGTYVNDTEIPKTRYYELRNSDVIKFGTSSREYVLLHEGAA